MKKLAALLQTGNLTPKERYLLLIQNDIVREKTGKAPLTETDIKALEDWRAETNEQAAEWNKYNEGWKLSGRAGLEVEFIYWQTSTEHYRKSFINMQLRFYPFYRDIRHSIAGLEKIKKVDLKEAIEIINKQREQKLKDGLDFDYAVYMLAFESLSDQDKKRFNELYPDIEYDHQYLDQEEIIANLFNGKDELIKEAKKKLAELVAENCYNDYAKEYQLYHYFACIPLAEVARQFLISKDINVKGKLLAKNQEADDEDSKTHKDIQEVIENYARDNKITIEAILKEACLKWLDEDLFEQYRPLVISDEKELLNRWLKTKAEARATLQKLIDKGELKIQDETGQDKTIIGESLYNFKGDYKFIKEFKERVDRYDANLGIVCADDDPEQKGDNLDQELLICNRNEAGESGAFSVFDLSVQILKNTFEATQFIKETKKNSETILDFNNEKVKQFFKEIRESLINGYAKLLAFEEIFKKLSKIYEIDTGYFSDIRLKSVSEFIDDHNDALSKAMGQKLPGGEVSEGAEGLFKHQEVLKTKDDLFIDKDKILPDIEISETWNKKFGEIFSEF